jgi:hypothetical protein
MAWSWNRGQREKELLDAGDRQQTSPTRDAAGMVFGGNDDGGGFDDGLLTPGSLHMLA